MIYIIYRITHEGYPILNYVGSCVDLDIRIMNHKSVCYNEKSEKYNFKLYKFVRNNEINFDTLEFTVLNTMDIEYPKISEQMYINFYNSIENGLNDRNAYTSQEYKNEQLNGYNKEYRKLTWNCIICGIITSKSGKSQHVRTKKHKRNVYQNL